MSRTPSTRSNRGDATASTAESTNDAREGTTSSGTTNRGRSATTDEESDEDEIDLDRVFDALSNERRRETLRYLRTADEPVELGDLAEHVAAVENDTSVRELDSKQRKRVYVGLYQCHLKRLDAMGIVTFDQDRARVGLGPNAARVYEYLPDDEEASRPWLRYYLGYAATSFVVFWLAVVGGGVTVAEWAAITAATVVGLFGLAVVTAFDGRTGTWFDRPMPAVIPRSDGSGGADH